MQAWGDTEHLRDFVFNAIIATKDVNHVETVLIYDHVNTTLLLKYNLITFA